MKQFVTTRRASRPLRWLAAAVVGVLGTFATAQETPQRAPNIVFLIADDLGIRDIGAWGQDQIRTPNLDKLAGEGVKLSTHYTGNSVCAPSRNVLLSGKHPGHAFIRTNRQDPTDKRGTLTEGGYNNPEGFLQFPLTLKQLGYTSGGYGKWGQGTWAGTGSPLKQGFDHFVGYICQGVAHNYYPEYIWDDGKQVFLNNPKPSTRPSLPEGANPQDPASYKQFEGTQYAPDLYTDAALKFVRDNKDKPFFLFYPTIVPHLGYQVPADSLAEYEGKFPEEPYTGRGAYVPVRNPRATYAAQVTRMDRDIGRIIAQVKELGLEENTIFVFTSDNGGPGGGPNVFFNSNGNFRSGKGGIYEGAFRTSGIVRWKGKIAPGRTVDRVTGFEDWFPTLLELAGQKAKIPTDIDGISFAPTLLGEQQPARPFLYREFPNQGQFVRVGDWKAVRTGSRQQRSQNPATQPSQAAQPRGFPGAADPVLATPKEPGKIELYNLALDPSEQKDVADQNPEIVKQLETILNSEHTPSDIFPLAVLGEEPARK